MSSSHDPIAHGRTAAPRNADPAPAHSKAEEAYRALMEHIDLPETVRASVLSEARRQSSAAETAREHLGSSQSTIGAPHANRPHKAPEPRTSRSRRSSRRAIAVAACLVLACGIGCIALASLPLLQQGTNPTEEDAPGAPHDTDSLADGQASGNSFALRAYADEAPEDTAGEPVTLTLGDFAPAGSSETLDDPFTDGYYEEEDRSWMLACFSFDITCVGEGIESITYEIEGGRAYFNWYDEMEFLRAHGVYGSDDPAVTEGWYEYQGAAFTVEYHEQDLREGYISCDIVVPVLVDDEMRAIRDELDSAAVGQYDQELYARFDASYFAKAAQALADSPLTLTATFSDGSTQTKAYRLAPVENFEQAYLEYYELRSEASDAYSQALEAGEIDPNDRTITVFDFLPEDFALFTLTEVSK